MGLPKHMQAPGVREILRRLRKHAPLCAPVRVVQVKEPRTHDGEVCLGYMEWRARGGRVERFKLVLERRLTAGEKFDVIVHEWAHGLDRGRRLRPRDCHDTRWGQCFARAYQASRKW